MTRWRSQDYASEAGRIGADAAVIRRATQTGKIIQRHARGAEPVYTLRHLSHVTGVSYAFLRSVVERADPAPYRMFRIKKRTLGSDGKARYRIICVPDPRLMKVQRWINTRILPFATPHEASVAFGEGDNIVAAATPHCGCRWLIKLDIVNFFESVSEQSAFHVFRDMGFQPLIAFELSRLCTRQGKASRHRSGGRWHSSAMSRDMTIASYAKSLLGHLPQGAPTSPVLANLAVKRLDDAIAKVAASYGLIYTRYADDLTFSTTSNDFSRIQAGAVVRETYRQLRFHGFEPNLAKTAIVPPGSRRVVLGLLVDGDKPRLSKAFRDRLGHHLYYLADDRHGPSRHAAALGFQSVYGLRNHVYGLVAYAAQVDRALAEQAWRELNAISWP